jgi:hypothetical protein
MLKKSIIFLLIILFQIILFQFSLFSEDTGVKNPTDPTVGGDNTKVNDPKYNMNIFYKKQNGSSKKGVVKGMKGFYIKGLTWEGNEGGDQDILIDFVKSIKITGYTMIEKKKDNLSTIFYYPYIFDISLTDGTKITGAKGRINELASFELYNDVGKEKCFTYFIRYWLNDEKMFSDNKSKVYEETPKIPASLVVYLEFNK